jgi:putative acetyltransferase
MEIRRDDLTHPAVIALLDEHLANMYEISPPESVHALDLTGLRDPSITFWTAWEGEELLGCGALKELDPTHGEIKSMRTTTTRRRTGAGRAILRHIIETARSRGYARLSLETGAEPAFAPARALYEGSGFSYCEPFAAYTDDPLSVFLTLDLHAGSVSPHSEGALDRLQAREG